MQTVATATAAAAARNGRRRASDRRRQMPGDHNHNLTNAGAELRRRAGHWSPEGQSSECSGEHTAPHLSCQPCAAVRVTSLIVSQSDSNTTVTQ